MSKERRGTLLKPGRDGIQRCRVTETVTVTLPDGKVETRTERPIYKLGTTDPVLARRRMARLVTDLAAGKRIADAVEMLSSKIVALYVEEWLADREARGIHGERCTLETFVLAGDRALCHSGMFGLRKSRPSSSPSAGRHTRAAQWRGLTREPRSSSTGGS